MNDDRDHLVAISEALTRINKYAAKGRSHFDKDELIQCWIVHHLRILCDHAEALSLSFKGNHSRIPWARLSHLGKSLADHPFSWDHDAIWKSLETDLMPLRDQLTPILREFFDDE